MNAADDEQTSDMAKAIAIDKEKLKQDLRKAVKDILSKPKPNRAQRRALARGKKYNQTSKSKAQLKREVLAEAIKRAQTHG